MSSAPSYPKSKQPSGNCTWLTHFCERLSSKTAKSKSWKLHYWIYVHWIAFFYFHITFWCDVLPYWPEDRWNQSYIIVYLIGGLGVFNLPFYETVRRMNPGFVERNKEDEKYWPLGWSMDANNAHNQTNDKGGVKSETNFEPVHGTHPSGLPYCPSCRTLKYIRSKHDRFTNRCVHRFDHFCPYTNAVIAANNFCFYVILLYLCFTNTALLSMESYRALIYDDMGYGFRFWRLVLCCIIQIPFILGSAALVVSYTHKVLHNYTHNEFKNHFKYDHVQFMFRHYRNSFDVGRFHNIRECFNGFKGERVHYTHKVLYPEPADYRKDEKKADAKV